MDHEDTVIEHMLFLLRIQYLQNRAEGMEPAEAQSKAKERLKQLADNCAFAAFDIACGP